MQAQWFRFWICISFLSAGTALAWPADLGELAHPPGSLELVGLLHDDSALSRPHDVELQGNLAFVPGKGGSLAIIDVTDPTSPRLVSSMVDPIELEDAETVLPMGDVLLLGTRDFFAIDISNPARPAILKKLADRPRIDRINGMALRGKHVLTANKSGFIGVFDVSDPKNPVYVEALASKDKGGPQRPHDIAVWGDYAIVVDTEQHQPGSVYVYRIARPGTAGLLPVREWTIEGKVANTDNARDLQGANRVVVWGGRYAGVGAFVPDRVGMIDLADPRRLRQLANMPVCDIDATGMAVAGSILWVAGGECVEAIDVSDPGRPESIAQYRRGRLFPTRRFLFQGEARFDNGHDLVYRDGYVYVTAQNDNRLGILKVADPRVRRLADSPAE